jgi:hypothetical protein
MRFPIVFLCSALCAVSGTGCRSANTAEHSALHPSQRLKDALVSELRSQFASSVVPVEFSSEQVHFSPPGRSVRNGLNLLLADVRPASIRRPHGGNAWIAALMNSSGQSWIIKSASDWTRADPRWTPVDQTTTLAACVESVSLTRPRDGSPFSVSVFVTDSSREWESIVFASDQRASAAITPPLVTFGNERASASLSRRAASREVSGAVACIPRPRQRDTLRLSSSSPTRVPTPALRRVRPRLFISTEATRCRSNHGTGPAIRA